MQNFYFLFVHEVFFQVGPKIHRENKLSVVEVVGVKVREKLSCCTSTARMRHLLNFVEIFVPYYLVATTRSPYVDGWIIMLGAGGKLLIPEQ